jgi:hypothetical protein
MVSRVHVLLDGMGRGVTTVAALYERDVAREDLSDQLVYAILHVITDGQNSLDWVAAALDQQPYGKQKERSPCFPLTTKADDFDNVMAKDFPRLPPSVRAAMARHQPSEPDKVQLGYLDDLARVNKFQGFTTQARTLNRRLERGGLRIDAEPLEPGRTQFGGQVTSGSVPLDPRMLQPLTNASPVFREVNYVGWNFSARPPRLPAVPVLPTLQTLYELVTAAVADVRHEAGL